MGQKISVKFFRARKRLSNVNNNSADVSQLQPIVWFASKSKYAKSLSDDLAIKKLIEEKIKFAGVANIIIRRYFRKVEITIFTPKPGLIIGKGGATINGLKESLVNQFGLPADLKLEIIEFKEPYTSANIVAEEIVNALTRNVPFRRLAKTYLDKIRYAGILGARISIKGRLNGAEIARKEDFAYGSIPRHTIDSNIDYSYIPAQTKAGVIGVKVWLYKGDKLKNYTY